MKNLIIVLIIFAIYSGCVIYTTTPNVNETPQKELLSHFGDFSWDRTLKLKNARNIKSKIYIEYRLDACEISQFKNDNEVKNELSNIITMYVYQDALDKRHLQNTNDFDITSIIKETNEQLQLSRIPITITNLVIKSTIVLTPKELSEIVYKNQSLSKKELDKLKIEKERFLMSVYLNDIEKLHKKLYEN